MWLNSLLAAWFVLDWAQDICKTKERLLRANKHKKKNIKEISSRIWIGFQMISIMVRDNNHDNNHGRDHFIVIQLPKLPMLWTLFFRFMTEVVDMTKFKDISKYLLCQDQFWNIFTWEEVAFASYRGLTILLLLFQRPEGDLMTDFFSVP